jgi:AcrR family transcriptional regulator
LHKSTRRRSAPAVADRKPRRRSTEENVDRILRAAADEFKTAGFAGATTASIARKADVTQTQLFRYFDSKTQLFREAVFKPLDQHFLDFLSRLRSAASAAATRGEKSRLYISELQQFLTEHSQLLLSLVVAQTYEPDSTQGVHDIDSVRAYFERGAALMASRMAGTPKVDPKLMVRVSFAAILGCIFFKEWLLPADMASENEISAAIADFMMDGINANSDRRR